MKNLFFSLSTFVFYFFSFSVYGQSEVSQLLRTRLESEQPGQKLEVQGISLLTSKEINSFYSK